MILADGLRLSCTGLGIGLLVTAALTRFLKSFLYGVRAFDPFTFTFVSALILVVAVIACLTPAWRAASVDPLHALRHQ